MALRPTDPLMLCICATRTVVALLLWFVAHWCAMALVYGGFYLPEYVSDRQLWALPAAWAVALGLGTRVAAGGGLPGPGWRVLPFVLLAGWMTQAAVATFADSLLYPVWTGGVLLGALMTGVLRARRTVAVAAI